MKLAAILSILRPKPLGGDTTPGGVLDAYVLEDESGGYLKEDGTSTLLMETAP
jgi:hypothetical protein